MLARDQRTGTRLSHASGLHVAAAGALVMALASCDYSSYPMDDGSSGDSLPDSGHDTWIDTGMDTGADTHVDPGVDTWHDPGYDPGSVCGNGIQEAGEVCDGYALPCALLHPGYVGGEAACLYDCTGYDEAACLTFEEMRALVQRAACITGDAQIALLGLDLVGMYEWEVKAAVDASFASSGADPELAFDHIVASGPNAIVLHYAGGDRMIQDGDLVLIDIGARFSGYCGDISRTIPGNGAFTPRQRELFELVLAAQLGAAAAMRPGVDSLDDMTWWTVDFLAASPLRALDEYGVERTMDHFFVHALCHYIGTDVHASDLFLDPSMPANVGEVFTIEPGLYIASEGIGIRIEDDFVLTDAGAVDLCPGAPKTVEDIEAAMSGSWPIRPLPDLASFIEARRASPYPQESAASHMDW